MTKVLRERAHRGELVARAVFSAPHERIRQHVADDVEARVEEQFVLQHVPQQDPVRIHDGHRSEHGVELARMTHEEEIGAVRRDLGPLEVRRHSEDAACAVK